MAKKLLFALLKKAITFSSIVSKELWFLPVSTFTLILGILKYN